MNPNLKSTLLGLLGAAVGGIVGYFAVGWLANQGLYAIILPGALLGLGCSALARHRSVARGILCAVAALCAGLVTEWRNFPFNADKSLAYFLRHVGELRTWTYIMIGLGAALAFWWGGDSHDWTGGKKKGTE